MKSIQNDARKPPKNDWNPGMWVLIWEYSAGQLCVLVPWTKVASALEAIKEKVWLGNTSGKSDKTGNAK